jgi:parallel beta-helix repeat protein
MKWKLAAAEIFAAAAMLAWAASAGAVDGTIEINQAKVLAKGGFPFTIGSFASRSYRLTGDLTVLASQDAIDVSAANVTIDLNGFSITGPGTSGTVVGINASGNVGVTVENGTVTGFHVGVEVGSNGGANGIVRNVHADANVAGILVGSNSVVEGCTANNSTPTLGTGIGCIGQRCAISGNTTNGNGDGIDCNFGGCVISGNTASKNTSDGIFCGGTGCLVSDNTLIENSIGIDVSDTTSGYKGNVMNANSSHDHLGGTSLGNNLCSGTIC